MKSSRLLLWLLLLLQPTLAHAWWNEDWKERTVVSLNTGANGVPVQETLNGLAVPVRLHSGNFDFVSAKADGSDLRVVAADDKTPLKFWVERFDSVNELAVVWVLLPNVLPATDKNVLYVYAGNGKAAADSNGASTPDAVVDSGALAAFHFAEKDGAAADQTGTIKATAPVAVETNGLIGQSARINGTPIVWPDSDKLRPGPTGAYTVSFWVRPDAAQGTLFQQGPLQLTLTAGQLAAKLGTTTVSGGALMAATWSQIVLSLGANRIALYVDGKQVGHADLPASAPPIAGQIQVGAGYQGLLDELQLAGVARSDDWIRLAYAAEGADAMLLTSQTEAAGAKSGGSNSYFGVLFKALTPDAWAIIGVLAVMFLIAVSVMAMKSIYVSRTESANRMFLQRFRSVQDVLKVEDGKEPERFGASSLYRLYCAGLKELTRREIGQGDRRLSGASLDAVKAAVDADSVREGYVLNSQMVLLTIAISGGPFLGLLGTVVGVMITFASIAAAGDVNVNAIAPGIAAALLATVAGLGVAIPSLFGYNYLASRIKTISSDMQIFIDEFVTRVAETYGAH